MLSEPELIAKLVAQWHLDAHERKALPAGEAKGSLVVAEIERSVSRTGRYPTSWRLEAGFDGGLVELQSDGNATVYWKAETGMSRFEFVEILNYSSLHEACAAYAKRFFGEDIDGVPIAWAV